MTSTKRTESFALQVSGTSTGPTSSPPMGSPSSYEMSCKAGAIYPHGRWTSTKRTESFALQVSGTSTGPTNSPPMGSPSSYKMSCKAGAISAHGRWNVCISRCHMYTKAIRRPRSRSICRGSKSSVPNAWDQGTELGSVG
jgi:hypothetical protein